MYRSLEEELKKWRDSKNRYPLLLRGARQVGKTYLIENFGKMYFDSYISIDFEAQPEAIACFDTFNPKTIITKLQTILKESIVIGKTLLFLDEIQACPKAIMALRYFREKMPNLHIIGAGSLLEFALTQKKISFPVGRVQFLYLKPLSFKEYVIAKNKNLLAECQNGIKDFSINNSIHNEMIDLIKEYFLIGGMPAAISEFLDNYSLEKVTIIQEILLSTYQADFSKYAKTVEQKYLKILFEGLFSIIAEQFKYSKIDPNIRSRDLKNALDHLEWAGLIERIYSSSATSLPISAQIKRNRFKILFLDIGLMQHALQTDPSIILKKNFIQANRGAVTEQFVGQELLSYCNFQIKAKLFYWQREKVGSDAEIDYLYVFHNYIIPIEVKSGATGRLKSLNQFMKEKKSPIGIKISQHPLEFKNNILSLPFYLISELPNKLKNILKI